MKITFQVPCVLALLTVLTACTGQMKPIIPTQTSPVATKTILISPTQTMADAYPVQDSPQSVAEAYPPGYISSTPSPKLHPTSTMLPTILPTLRLPTITALPTKPAPALPSASCFPSKDDGDVLFPLPDLKNLQWERTNTAGFPAQRLTGLNTPIWTAIPSPYGTSLAIPIMNRIKPGLNGASYYGLLILEGPGKTPWLATRSFDFSFHALQWLPENYLIWIDQGNVNTARIDGSEKVQFSFPEPAIEVWSNGKRAIVSGKSALWWLNLSTGEWSEIKGVGSISFPDSNATLTPDLSEVLINYGGMLVQISLDPPWTDSWYEDIEYTGHGGRIGPPSAIGMDYLFPGVIESKGNNERQMLLFERGNPRAVPLSNLITLAEGQYPLGLSVSPDSRWVAFAIYIRNKNDPGILDKRIGDYIAPTDDLISGTFIPHGDTNDSGWRIEPPAYFYSSGGEITQVSLPSFEQKVLGRGGRFLYSNVRQTVIENGIFNPDGNLKSLLQLPYPLDTTMPPIRVGNNGEIYWSFWNFQKRGEECVTTAWLEVMELSDQ